MHRLVEASVHATELSRPCPWTLILTVVVRRPIGCSASYIRGTCLMRLAVSTVHATRAAMIRAVMDDGAAVEPLTVPQCTGPDADTAVEQGSAYANVYF